MTLYPQQQQNVKSQEETCNNNVQSIFLCHNRPPNVEKYFSAIIDDLINSPLFLLSEYVQKKVKLTIIFDQYIFSF